MVIQWVLPITLCPTVCSREQRVPNKDLVKLFIRAHALRSNSLVNSPWVVDENFVRKHSLPPVVYPSPQKVLGLCSLAAFTHTHTRLTALCPGLPGWACTRKAKPIWILLKQETVSGSGISWAICKSAPCSRQTATSSPHHSVFYRPDDLPVTQPTASKHSMHHYYPLL